MQNEFVFTVVRVCVYTRVSKNRKRSMNQIDKKTDYHKSIFLFILQTIMLFLLLSY